MEVSVVRRLDRLRNLSRQPGAAGVKARKQWLALMRELLFGAAKGDKR